MLPSLLDIWYLISDKFYNAWDCKPIYVLGSPNLWNNCTTPNTKIAAMSHLGVGLQIKFSGRFGI